MPESATDNVPLHGFAPMDRRTFVKASGTLAALAAAGQTIVSKDSPIMNAYADDRTNEDDACVWSACGVNCEGRCALRLHVKDDQIHWVESDTTPGSDEDDQQQIRACLRGRTIRRWINSPDRLRYPMRRTGARGSGQFERISWDEAIDTIASEYQRVLDQYGPEAIEVHYATGVMSKNERDFIKRLLCMNGGYLNEYGSYSSAQISRSIPFLYGSKDNNANSDIKNSKLVVAFGENAIENKMSGGGAGYNLSQALEKGDAKLISIDPKVKIYSIILR